nr:cytochrome c3 family protein [Sphingomonadaceae bacterium]
GVGRDASNEIHLADLAVEPFHARLTLQPNGRVLAETVGGLGFGVDGRVTKKADIDATRGAELRFGGHLLKLARDDEAATVTVERTAALSDISDEKDESLLFSLKGLVPGKRIGAWGFALLVLAAFLAWPVWSYATWHEAKTRPQSFHADQMWTAGPLSQAHHGLEKDCQACHAKAFEAVTDAKCVVCHKDTHDHADLKRQVAAMAPPDLGGRVQNFFKASFGFPTGQRCANCHNEHQGAGPMPPTRQAFCTDCHATLKERLTDTRLADAGDFGTAHPNFTAISPVAFEGDRPLFRRLSLDGRPKEDDGLKFTHARHLSTTNGVARMAQTLRGQQGWGASLTCNDCHKATADGVRFLPVDMETNCQMCHSLTFDRVGGTYRTLRHGQPAQVVADLRAFYRSTAPDRPIALGGFARRVPGSYAAGQLREDYLRGASRYAGGADAAINALFTKGGACFDCHIVDRTGEAATMGWHVRKPVQPMRYMAQGWFDHAAHRTEKCETCHAAATTSNDARDLLLPTIGKLGDQGGKTCRSCHGGEASHAQVKSGCAMCHSYHIDAAAPWRSRIDPARAVRRATVAFNVSERR